LDVVGFQGVAAVTVETVGRAGRGATGGRNHFHVPLETAEEVRYVTVEVDKNIVELRRRLAAADDDRRQCVTGVVVVASDMRHETVLAECPQHAVQRCGLLRIGGMQVQSMPCRMRLFRQPAGEIRRGIRRVAVQDVKRNFRHAALRALSARYCTSRPTGRPVAPFSAPDFQATPAMSRCAHRSLRVKRCRKLAAVMAPALRPPTLAKSAKLLSRSDWYSSHSGIGQARS